MLLWGSYWDFWVCQCRRKGRCGSCWGWAFILLSCFRDIILARKSWQSCRQKSHDFSEILGDTKKLASRRGCYLPNKTPLQLHLGGHCREKEKWEKHINTIRCRERKTGEIETQKKCSCTFLLDIQWHMLIHIFCIIYFHAAYRQYSGWPEYEQTFLGPSV